MLEMEKRIFTDAYGSALRDRKYKGHTERAIELGRKIMELLGRNSLIFLEYERYASLAEGIYLEDVYSAGLEDGLSRSMGVCSTKCSTKLLEI